MRAGTSQSPCRTTWWTRSSARRPRRPSRSFGVSLRTPAQESGLEPDSVAQIPPAGSAPRFISRCAVECPTCCCVDTAGTMVVWRRPEGRLCEAALAKGLDHRRHERPPDPLAPHCWIGVESVEFSYSAAVGVSVLRRPDKCVGDHPSVVVRDEHLPAWVDGCDFVTEGVDGWLNSLQISL